MNNAASEETTLKTEKQYSKKERILIRKEKNRRHLQMTKKLIRRIILISDACLWLLCLIILIASGLTATDWGTEPLDIFMSKGVFKVFIIFSSVGLLRSIFGFFCFELTGRGAEKNHTALRTLNRALYVAGVVLFDLAVALCLYGHGPEYAAVALCIVWAAVLLTNIVLFVICLIRAKTKTERAGT